LIDLESALPNEGRDVARYVATLKHPLKKRFSPFLPASHTKVRSKTVFEENELATWLQDSRDALNRIDNAWNCA